MGVRGDLGLRGKSRWVTIGSIRRKKVPTRDWGRATEPSGALVAIFSAAFSDGQTAIWR